MSSSVFRVLVVIAFCFQLLNAHSVFGAKKGATCKAISSNELKRLLDSKEEKTAIVDYRLREDYYGGHIPDATFLSTMEREGLQLKLELFFVNWKRNGVTGVIVDNDGENSNTLCKYMINMFGYKQIYSLEGGMKEWNGPVKKDRIKFLKEKVKRKMEVEKSEK